MCYGCPMRRRQRPIRPPDPGVQPAPRVLLVTLPPDAIWGPAAALAQPGLPWSSVPLVVVTDDSVVAEQALQAGAVASLPLHAPATLVQAQLVTLLTRASR